MLVVVIMVKNEEENIVETLESYRVGGIDKYLLYDTGSTDETISKYLTFVKKYGLDGKVYELPFTDFSTSRNAGLKKARELYPECTFAFMPDAEWYIENPKGLLAYCEREKENLADTHDLFIKGNITFAVRRLFRLDGGAKFRGGTHEIAIGTHGGTIPKDVCISYQPSNRSNEASQKRWYRDLGILLHDVMKDHDPRDIFYLAQTYECLGQHDEAIKYYSERGGMENGFFEERFMAYYRLGKIYDAVKNWNLASEAYLKAYEVLPSRIEPLVKLAQHYANPQIKYLYARQACLVPYPENHILFVDNAAYDFDRWEQLAIGADYIGTVEAWIEAINAGKRALKARPGSQHVINNLKITGKRLINSGKLSDDQVRSLGLIKLLE